MTNPDHAPHPASARNPVPSPPPGTNTPGPYTQPASDSTTVRMLPILLTQGRQHPMLHAHKDRALKAGVLVACDLDTRHDPDPPCGAQHGGGTYYHLKAGKTMDHYHAAAAHPRGTPTP